MELFHSFDQFSSYSRPSAVAIGNFDGIHLGHQKILKFLEEKAREHDLLSLVLTFSPHPEKVLGENRICTIQTLDQRIREINKFNIQAVLVTPFDKKFSNLSGHDFIQKIISDTLKAEVVIVGENFRFGKDREGDTSLLRRLSSLFRFQVHSIPSVILNGETVSSSLVRQFLQEGRVEKARALLGRNYEIEGTVIKGHSRGKSLGFPTANIKTENEIIPQGVFITQTRIGPQTFPSMTNVGSQPTFKQKGMHIESFIIDFEKELYGEHIALGFLEKIRDEIKFRTPADLIHQLEKDLAAAKDFFKGKL
ncbi:MAG: bifunctional riboflavin kinase/FAD synthetase [Candidatus Aminicenantes bacterium]|nr:bifunctional riboflavin kinase/FAD synthetase [Candidatus Aminicenantes bacterium]MDH5466038.1 bifunctional riboflavin kinase/FAD synthetase [Candidatus Aminicenantes bacterium]MDH5704987.1 bifunctional riboflavin kinase/FAD synthetase [Candidatus Aminicenantes bacterium]